MIGFNLIKCPSCQSFISRYAKKCPKCQETLNQDELNKIVENDINEQMSVNFGCFTLIICLFISMIIMYFVLINLPFISTLIVFILTIFFTIKVTHKVYSSIKNSHTNKN